MTDFEGLWGFVVFAFIWYRIGTHQKKQKYNIPVHRPSSFFVSSRRFTLIYFPKIRDRFRNSIIPSSGVGEAHVSQWFFKVWVPLLPLAVTCHMICLDNHVHGFVNFQLLRETGFVT